MDRPASVGGPANSRIKACSACRQHKIRCDAARDGTFPCRRCRIKGWTCEVGSGTHGLQRAPTRTDRKRELQDQVTSLRRLVQGLAPIQPACPATDAPVNLSLTPPLTTTTDKDSELDIRESKAFSQHEEVAQASAYTPSSSRRLEDLEVSQESINDCFTLFHRGYASFLPIIENQLDPDTCYNRSHLLFWTIVGIGARKYAGDPTLLTSITPRLRTLIGTALMAREKSLATVQALALLCSWPLPYDSLSHDTSPMLAGVLLSHSLTLGLHVYGIGQDFARAKLERDISKIRERTRLWFLVLTTCQRVHFCTGLPPPAVPDMCAEEFAESHVPAAAAFEKRVSGVQAQGLLQLEQLRASTPYCMRATNLCPLINAVFAELSALEDEHSTDVGNFYLEAAKLQVLTFYFLVPYDAKHQDKLYQVHDLSCSILENAQRIDRHQTLAYSGPIFLAMYAKLAACSILKILRSPHISGAVDESRGRKAYFFAIELLRNMSVESGDVHSRAAGILTQLWTSKKIFRKSDGTTDSLMLRCDSRLGMSVLFDCHWWWRWEFGGQRYPYDDRLDENAPADGSQVLNHGGNGGVPQPFDDVYPDLAWTITADLDEIDWTPLLNNGDAIMIGETGPTSLWL